VIGRVVTDGIVGVEGIWAENGMWEGHEDGSSGLYARQHPRILELTASGCERHQAGVVQGCRSLKIHVEVAAHTSESACRRCSVRSASSSMSR
jgi:hypothetical protein